jgi:hypothetical protein
VGDEGDDVLHEVIAQARKRWIEDVRLEFISATETSRRWQDFMRLHEIADGWPEYKETAWEEWKADTLAAFKDEEARLLRRQANR